MNDSQRLAEDKDKIEVTLYWQKFVRKLNEMREKKRDYISTQTITLANIGKVSQEQGRISAYREVLDIWDGVLKESMVKERK